MALSVSFIRLVSSTNVTQATRLRPSTSVGLAPTEQTSLCWTHCVANSQVGRLRHLFRLLPCGMRDLIILLVHLINHRFQACASWRSTQIEKSRSPSKN